MGVSKWYLASVSTPEKKPLHISELQWDIKRRSVTIGNLIVTFTATEFRLLYPLRSGAPVTYADLAWYAYNYTVDEKVRVMMDKHIDRIRGKLRGSGVYIYCVLNYGYLLLPEAQ
ncbi:transcriptional regulator [Thermosporothrix hazakensis]|jgi:DNA-binding response OmpR family regulator|uniref:Transcriptional regulator n=1 Tax=Thermosporothrix hazakensis TaxID=644383 RepID=A0A326U984_THEHA|nr:response regulator transcription factor [Thermosporothrix hazakensis]PZW32580.1 transcriptional regulator [Thermosporothrix hazakensis]GCE49934.1 hypothetical protein KTH_48030 [Thermosporothrix hazakensis]